MFVVLLVFLAMVTVVLAATIIVVAGIAHVVAQRATGAAADCSTDHATGVATDLLADDIATRGAQRAANGRFGTAATVCTNHATGRTTETGADCCARVATDLLANHRPHSASQGATQTGFGAAGKGEATAAQAKGKKEELQRLHGHLDYRNRQMASVTPLTDDFCTRFLAAGQLAALLPSRLPALAACRRIATNFEVGVLLPTPALSSGTSGLASGK